MIQKIKSILQDSFYQLLAVYTLIVFIIALGFLSKYSLQFNILAIIIGIIGALSLKGEIYPRKIDKKLHYSLLFVGLLLIFIIRIIPYFFTSIPLGYDPGMYKYGIEHGLENKDRWILNGGMEPGFLYLMEAFKLFFSSDFILKYLFIFFCVLLGWAIYLVSKEYFNEKTALFSLFIYALSLIQFKTFWFLYYKNVIGMATMLFSFYFLKRYEKENKPFFKWLFIIFGALTGIIHRPTFYIFGLSYFFYALISPYKYKKYDRKLLVNNILSGIIIIVLALLFYIKDFLPAITSILPWVAKGFIDTGQSPGTFIDFTTYQYSILSYFLFSIMGLIFCLRKKIGILEIWAVLNLSIVIFQFFFFNRFIIMLDIILIIFAGYSFSLITENKNKITILLIGILFLSMGIFAIKETISSSPLIDENEMETISYLKNTEENAFVMSTTSHYSPWIMGYSERKTIAPGLFDYNKHNEDEWIIFWTTSELKDVRGFLNAYEKPLYIFIGKRQRDNLNQFNQTGCFELIYSQEGNKIYSYLC